MTGSKLDFGNTEQRLERKDTFLEDTLINLETEKLQNELFQFRQRRGKEKIGAKDDCSNYLSDIFKRRKD